MEKLKNIFKKDMSRRALGILICCTFAAKAVLAWQQEIYVWVGGAPLDDELMYAMARSISAGNWLGSYNYLTLSKQMGFAVWLALCHLVHLPYLIAGQLLLCGAALAMAFAFAPVLKRNKSRFLLFAALAFSPAAAASFTLRVYRDNIFPSECILFFAGLIGVALRYRQGLKKYWLWLILAGVGFGMAKLTREDGIWLAPFALLGTGILLVAIVREKGLDKKVWRCLSLAVPFGILAAAVVAVSAVNYAYYGVFCTSDFSEGPFAAAYGAMTRVTHENDTRLVPVPKDVREKLYANVPQLARLKPWLEENKAIQNAYLNKELGDYQAGSFYWVLRRAAQEEGIYDNAADAAAYWQGVADAINAAIDEGALEASCGPRSTTTPIIRGRDVLPTIAEALHSVVFCATFEDCSCYYYKAEDLSLILPEDAAEYAAYLGSVPNYAAVEGGAEPYYAPRQLLLYNLFDLLRLIYRVALPLMLIAAAALQIRKLVWMIRHKNADGLVLWLVLLGVLGMALLRCGMIAFMEVAAFQIGTYVMYLASVHPLLLTYAVAGIITGANLPTEQKGETT
ncbi:MAG: hypothetical protein LKJ90_02275 [Faecalibacterium sp.]|nr:hypothetical protein [Faecalibacterium sp.]